MKIVDDMAADDVVPVFALIMGRTMSFTLLDDEQADDSFDCYCYLHGRGKTEFNRKYKYKEDGDTVTITMNGNLNGFVVWETEEKFERKISGSKFVVNRKSKKLYGSIDFPNCNVFKDREFLAK